MVSTPKILSVLSCGLLLGFGLMGSAASAADKMNVPSPERLGGQAGLESEEGKLKGVTGEASQRLGGQAGLEVEEGKLKGATIERDKTIQGK